MPFQESKKFLRTFAKYAQTQLEDIPDRQARLLESVLANIPKNNPEAVINHIDHFCQQNWMMNLGDQKALIVKDAIQRHQPKTILELGCYCGYSSLVMTHASNAIIHTIDPSVQFTNVARRIHEHAGVADRIKIHVGTVQSENAFIKEHGAFDMIFIDHLKNLYLADFKYLQSLGAVRKGTVIVGDNIIYPGSPDYLAFFKQSELYDSTLYHSFVEYSDTPDAVLVSERIAE